MEGTQHMAPRRTLSQLCVPIRSLASLFQSTCTLNVYKAILPRRGYVRVKVESEGSLGPSAQCWAWPTGGIWVILDGRREGRERTER